MATQTARYNGYDLTAAIIQIDNAGTIAEYELDWANKITPATEKDTYTWKGSGKTRKIEALAAINLTLDADCIPLGLHAVLFDKDTITDASSGGILSATAVGIGGGNDTSGVQVGLILEGNSVKTAADGTETTAKIRTWYPVGTLTLSAPPAFNAGAISEKWQYAFSASKTTVDIAGDAITGLAAGEYAIIGEAGTDTP